MRIVFDLDGTLVDSAPDIHGIANAVLAGEGAAPLTLAETRGFVGHGAPAFVARMRAARGLPENAQARLLAGFLERYDGAVGLTRPYDGVPEALAALAAAGHRLGLCTNKPAGPARAVLRHLDLAAPFAAVLGGDSLAVKKPDPAPLLETFRRLGTGACLFVGDSEVDAETARRAGIPFALFLHGYRKSPPEALVHAHRLDRFAELPALVAGLAAAA